MPRLQYTAQRHLEAPVTIGNERGPYRLGDRLVREKRVTFGRVLGLAGGLGAASGRRATGSSSNLYYLFLWSFGRAGAGGGFPSGYHELTAASDGLCAQGTPDIVQEPASGTSGSLWLPARQSDGSWQFQNQNSGLCLDIYGAGSNTGQQLDQWPCKNAAATNQDFTPH